MTVQTCEVAVIGAGIAGLTAASNLTRHGIETVVVDKARGPGGRSSTRRAGTLRFDHGAQYFTCRHDDFATQVREWRDAGVVAPWEARIASIDADGHISPTSSDTRRFVGVPGMNAMCKQLAEGVDCIFSAQVSSVERDSRWHLRFENGGRLDADQIVVSVPPEQTTNLLASVESPIHTRLAAVEMRPCWAAMLAFDRPLDLPFDAAFVNRGPLSWLANDSSKAGRTTSGCWVLHASDAYSAQHLEASPEEVAPDLLEALCAIAEKRLEPDHVALHRWRFSRAVRPLEEKFLHDPAAQLWVVGDWCAASRVEGAYLSGLRAADAMLA